MRVLASTTLLCLVTCSLTWSAGSDEELTRMNRLVERGQHTHAAEEFRAAMETEEDPDRRTLLAYNLGVALYTDGAYGDAVSYTHLTLPTN